MICFIFTRMKNKLKLCLGGLLAVVLISWGGVGHKTVATIAENHLTQQAKNAIKTLLGDQSIADIASWADEVRNRPEYKQTGPWHYVDLELGMNHEQFAAAIKAQGADNVYGAILKCEVELRSPATSIQQKTEALKFLVHFIGDSHQPMHVSRTEDKGGNSIPVVFNGKSSNLHSLWDSGLISREDKTFEQMAKDCDTATPAEIKKWQSDPPMQWLWESYQASTRIYTDVEKNNKLDDEYYKANIPVIQQRIEMGGIRLAGVLNELFKNGVPTSVPGIINDKPQVVVPEKADPKELGKYTGKRVITFGQVASGRLVESNNMTLLNVGADNPNQDFTIMIKSENRAKFGKPEIDLKGKMVVVDGVVIDYRGKPEIEVTDPKQLIIK